MYDTDQARNAAKYTRTPKNPTIYFEVYSTTYLSTARTALYTGIYGRIPGTQYTEEKDERWTAQDARSSNVHQ